MGKYRVTLTCSGEAGEMTCQIGPIIAQSFGHAEEEAKNRMEKERKKIIEISMIEILDESNKKWRGYNFVSTERILDSSLVKSFAKRFGITENDVRVIYCELNATSKPQYGYDK